MIIDDLVAVHDEGRGLRGGRCAGGDDDAHAEEDNEKNEPTRMDHRDKTGPGHLSVGSAPISSALPLYNRSRAGRTDPRGQRAG